MLAWVQARLQWGEELSDFPISSPSLADFSALIAAHGPMLVVCLS